jgi:hypothetical protein
VTNFGIMMTDSCRKLHGMASPETDIEQRKFAFISDTSQLILKKKLYSLEVIYTLKAWLKKTEFL